MGVEREERKPEKKSRPRMKRAIFELGTTASLTAAGLIVNNTAHDGTVRQVALGVAVTACIVFSAALARARR